MSRRTYTPHELTEPMLKRLSAIVSGRKHDAGTALDALERRGLVEPTVRTPYGYSNHNYPYIATLSGREALKRARREGW